MKKLLPTRFLLLSLLLTIIPLFIFADTTSNPTVYNVGNSWQTIEATSTLNPVFHMKINTDSEGTTLTAVNVKNLLNNFFFLTPAKEPSEIVSGSVKLWYAPADSSEFPSGTAQYVTHLVQSGGDYFNSTAFTQICANASALWITVDISSGPTPNTTLEFQSNRITFQTNPGGHDTINEPASPPFMIISSSTPGDQLQIWHTKTLTTAVTLSQSDFIPMTISFYNASGPNSADIVIESLSFTVKDAPGVGGTIISPASVFSYAQVKDAYQVFGDLSQGDIPDTTIAMEIPVYIQIPANTTITVEVAVNITGNAGALGEDFVVSMEDADAVFAYDFYTYKSSNRFPAPTDSFAMESNNTTILNPPGDINTWYSDTASTPVNKGMTNLEIFKLSFENPGDANTGSVEINKIKFYIENSANNPVTPKSIFSRIALTDETGTVTYAFKSSTQLSNTINEVEFDLSAVSLTIAGGNAVTLLAKVDISTTTDVDSFSIKTLTSASDITINNKNTGTALNTNPTLPAPFESQLFLLSSSVRVSKSNTQNIPVNIYQGQTGLHIMDILFSSPITVGGNTLLARGMTLTAVDKNSNPVNFSDIASKITAKSSLHTAVINSPPSSSVAFISFPEPVTIYASGETISIYLDIKSDISINNFAIELSNASDVFIYQSDDPQRNRSVFVSPLSDYSFPLSSGVGYISDSSTSLSFSNYPNPFKAGTNATLSYYLNSSTKVTLQIFDITGRLIRTIIEEEQKNQGGHEENFWDGKDSSGRYVLAGTYMVRILLEDKTSEIRKITLIK